MPHRRIKGLEGKHSVYHCMSRTVNGEFLFDDTAKAAFRTHLWRAAEFSGVQILTYAVLSNHFHVLVLVPDRAEAALSITDQELIRRYRRLYPQPTRFRPAQISVLERVLAAGGPEAARVRESLIARMHDVSEFMKTVKQGFSVWFNRTFNRFGTLWADRFRSTLIEFGRRDALLTVAAYIDLNPVRAHLVSDPKDYRWSGYGEAVAGDASARRGLARVVDGPNENSESAGDEIGGEEWMTMAAEYRLLLYGQGSLPRAFAASISEEDLREVVRRRGRLSLFELLHCRVRALIDGAVFGSRAFVLEQLARYREETHRRVLAGPQPLLTSDGVLLHSMRGFPAIGR